MADDYSHASWPPCYLKRTRPERIHRRILPFYLPLNYAVRETVHERRRRGAERASADTEGREGVDEGYRCDYAQRHKSRGEMKRRPARYKISARRVARRNSRGSVKKRRVSCYRNPPASPDNGRGARRISRGPLTRVTAKFGRYRSRGYRWRKTATPTNEWIHLNVSIL